MFWQIRSHPWFIWSFCVHLQIEIRLTSRWPSMNNCFRAKIVALSSAICRASRTSAASNFGCWPMSKVNMYWTLSLTSELKTVPLFHFLYPWCWILQVASTEKGTMSRVIISSHHFNSWWNWWNEKFPLWELSADNDANSVYPWQSQNKENVLKSSFFYNTEVKCFFVKYQPKKNKSVCLLSSMHSKAAWDHRQREEETSGDLLLQRKQGGSWCFWSNVSTVFLSFFLSTVAPCRMGDHAWHCWDQFTRGV